MEHEKCILTTIQVARTCHVSPRTACKWIDTGLLTGWRDAQSGIRQVQASELLKFLESHQMPTQGFYRLIASLSPQEPTSLDPSDPESLAG